MRGGGYEMRINARAISYGYAEGEAIVSKKPVSFYGDIDPMTGVMRDRNSDIYGESVAGKIFVFPSGRGSTVGSYVILRLKKNAVAPKAIINLRTDVVIAVGAIISEIPLVDKPEVDIFNLIKSGDFVKVSGYEGWIEIEHR